MRCLELIVGAGRTKYLLLSAAGLLMVVYICAAMFSSTLLEDLGDGPRRSVPRNERFWFEEQAFSRQEPSREYYVLAEGSFSDYLLAKRDGSSFRRLAIVALGETGGTVLVYKYGSIVKREELGAVQFKQFRESLRDSDFDSLPGLPGVRVVAGRQSVVFGGTYYVCSHIKGRRGVRIVLASPPLEEPELSLSPFFEKYKQLLDAFPR